MDRDALRALQAPLKEQYKTAPEPGPDHAQGHGHARRGRVAARSTPAARSPTPACTPPPAATAACCARATCCSRRSSPAPASRSARSATSLDIPIHEGQVHAEGDLDFRGTLGVDKTAPVGFSDIRLRFELDTDADDEQLATLLKLTERYCVVLQTLARGPQLDVKLERAAATA